jgi:hypothetical protein
LLLEAGFLAGFFLDPISRKLNSALQKKKTIELAIEKRL